MMKRCFAYGSWFLFLLVFGLAAAHPLRAQTKNDCPTGMSLVAKFEVNGGGDFVFEKGSHPGSVTIFNVHYKDPPANTEPVRADFSSTVPVNAVYVKASTNYKTDLYTPAVTSGTFSNDGLGNHAISNVSFCRGPETADLELDLRTSFSGDPQPGDEIPFTVVVFNNPMDGDPIQQGFADPGDPWPNPVAGTGIQVKVVLLGDKLDVAPHSASGGDYPPDTSVPGEVTFFIDNLAVGHHPMLPSDTLHLGFDVRVAPDATHLDSADVCVEVFQVAPEIDPDSDPGNMTVIGARAIPVEDEEDDEWFDRLPVELVSFDALLDGADVLLTWQTASETNNAGFEIQIRHEAQPTDVVNAIPEIREAGWDVLDFIEGAGTTMEPQRYTYRVEALAAGRHVFRLKQIDYDGAFAYSPAVEVAVALTGAYHLSPAYPNPCNPQAAFTLTVARAQQVKVEVFDALGRRVAVLYEGRLAADAAHRFTLEATGQPSGLYTYRATGETFVAQRQLVVVR